MIQYFTRKKSPMQVGNHCTKVYAKLAHKLRNVQQLTNNK